MPAYFRLAVLLAANLGDDADTTAAIAGQLAGAIYGAAGIPPGWLEALAWRERQEVAAGQLFDVAWPEAEVEEADRSVPENLCDDEDAAAAEANTLGNEFAACWITRDWTLRERLAALAGFQTVFERDGFQFATSIPLERDSNLTTLGWTELGAEAGRFYKMVYDYGWVRRLDWTAWRDTEAGNRMMHDADARSCPRAWCRRLLT